MATTALLITSLSFLLAAKRLTAQAAASMVFEPVPAPTETDRLEEDVLGPGSSAVLLSRRAIRSGTQPPSIGAIDPSLEGLR
jgi:hypothetical protein